MTSPSGTTATPSITRSPTISRSGESCIAPPSTATGRSDRRRVLTGPRLERSATCDAILDEGILFGADQLLCPRLLDASGAFGVASRSVGRVGRRRWLHRGRRGGLRRGGLCDVAGRSSGCRSKWTDANAEGDRRKGKTHLGLHEGETTVGRRSRRIRKNIRPQQRLP